jgi:hypothetical protein
MKKRLSRKPIFAQSGNPIGQSTGPAKEQTLIAEMAKGFLQAQANLNENTTEALVQEPAIQLLQKLNQQMEHLAQALQNNPKLSQSAQTGAMSQAADMMQQQNPEAAMQQQFSKIGGNQTPVGTQQIMETANQFKELMSQLTQKEPGGGSASGGNTSPVPAKTVSQVLAQAQYELATELENSLQKLREVINKSEQLANKIGNLLGEENPSKSSGGGQGAGKN